MLFLSELDGLILCILIMLKKKSNFYLVNKLKWGKLSYTLAKERELNKLYTFYALFLATLERRAEGNLSERSCFFDKNFQFLSKKQLLSDIFPFARLSSVARNSA